MRRLAPVCLCSWRFRRQRNIQECRQTRKDIEKRMNRTLAEWKEEK